MWQVDLLGGDIGVGFRRKIRLWWHSWSELEVQWRAGRIGWGHSVAAQGKNQSWMDGDFVRTWDLRFCSPF